MGPVLFSIFISGLENGTECIHIKFADDIKLGGVISMLEDTSRIQNDFETLQKWFEISRMKLNKAKCKLCLKINN